jgi:tetratricopeptide (TPR) repeat protein
MKKLFLLFLLITVLIFYLSNLNAGISPGLSDKKEVEAILGKPVKQNGNDYTYISKTNNVNLLTKIQYINGKVSILETDYYGSGISNMKVSDVVSNFKLGEPDFTIQKNRFDFIYFEKPKLIALKSKGISPESIVYSINYLSPRLYYLNKAVHDGAKNLGNNIGCKFRTITEKEKSDNNLNENGFIITEISSNSAFYKNGLKTGDIILLLNDEKFANLKDFKNYISKLKNKNNVSLLYKSANDIEFREFIIIGEPSENVAGDYYYRKALSLGQKEKNYKAALSEINRALIFDPENKKYVIFRASLFIDMKKYDIAEPILIKLTKKYPDNILYKQKLGKTYYRMNKFDESKKLFDIVLSKDKKNKSALYFTAWIYSKLKNYKKAVITINILLDERPNDSTYLYAKSDFLFKAGDYKSSINYCQEALKDRPEWYLPYYRIGLSYEKEGNCDKALENLQKSMELKPRKATLEFIKRLTALPKVNINNIKPNYDVYEKINRVKTKGMKLNIELTSQKVYGLKEIDLVILMSQKDTNVSIPTLNGYYLLPNGETGVKKTVKITPDNYKKVKVDFFIPYSVFNLPYKKHYFLFDIKLEYNNRLIDTEKISFSFKGGIKTNNKAEIKIADLKQNHNYWKTIGKYKYKGIKIILGLEGINIKNPQNISIYASIIDKSSGKKIPISDSSLIGYKKTRMKYNTTLSPNKTKQKWIFYPYSALGFTDDNRHDLSCKVYVDINGKTLATKYFQFYYQHSSKPEVVKVESGLGSVPVKNRPRVDITKLWVKNNVRESSSKAAKSGFRTYMNFNSENFKNNKLKINMYITTSDNNKIKTSSPKYLLSDNNVGLARTVTPNSNYKKYFKFSQFFIPYNVLSFPKGVNELKCNVTIYSGNLLMTKKNITFNIE